jgi:hypothetical protein
MSRYFRQYKWRAFPSSTEGAAPSSGPQMRRQESDDYSHNWGDRVLLPPEDVQQLASDSSLTMPWSFRLSDGECIVN